MYIENFISLDLNEYDEVVFILIILTIGFS